MLRAGQFYFGAPVKAGHLSTDVDRAANVVGEPKRVELYRQVRRAVYVEGISQREAARRFGIDPRTVAKMLAFSLPPGYRRSQAPVRPKLDPYLGIIDRI